MTSKNGVKINSIEIFANVNATEDKEKLIEALKRFFPVNNKELKLEIQNLSGAYGNSIKKLRFLIKQTKHINLLLSKLKDLIDDKSKEMLFKQFKLHLNDRGIFFIRFNKYSLFDEKIVISNKSDVILMKIKFSKAFINEKNFIESIKLFLIEYGIIKKVK
ncbi:MAG: RNA-binding domain-containing protein [Promethearchaeota archaeon]